MTYNITDVPLSFATGNSVNWVGYSIEGKKNATINGNTTLTGLSNGLHNVTIYANDTFGNMGASQTVTFTIAKPEPFPTATVAVISGTSSIVVTIGCLLVYIKRHKRSQ